MKCALELHAFFWAGVHFEVAWDWVSAGVGVSVGVNVGAGVDV